MTVSERRPESPTRRGVACLAAAATLSSLTGGRARAGATGAERFIWAVNQLGEEVLTTYRYGEVYDPAGMARLRSLLRDVHQNVPGPLPPLLIDLLSLLQERWNYERPLLIRSGYRTAHTNALIEGAAPASFHLRGLAADVSLRGIPPVDLANSASWLSGRLGFMGLGLYSNFLHLDLGPQRNWTR